LRDFSAPVILERTTTNAERAFLFAHDTDPFNRWEAGRALAREALLAMIRDGAAPDPAYLDAVHTMLRDEALDPAFRALALGLPGEDELAQALFAAGETPDPQTIWEAREALDITRAEAMRDTLDALYAAHQVSAPYRPDPDQAGARALANAALGLITRRDGGARALAQYDAADNMTQQLAALACLLRAGKGAEVSDAFYRQWRHDRLVLDKWFGLQILNAGPDTAAETAARLTEHPDFTLRNPNRFRAVLGALAGFPAGFHHVSGRGYRLMADMLIALDPLNPQTTARICTAFETWRRLDRDRQAMILAQIDRILAAPGLSRDTTEMLSRIREG
jgi:aminopeptidase N